MRWFRFQHEEPDNAATLLADPRLVGGDAPRIVVEHHRRWFADSCHVVTVCIGDERPDGIEIAGMCLANRNYARGIHDVAWHRAPSEFQVYPAATAAGTAGMRPSR